MVYAEFENCGRLAQMDRALVSETRGRGSESHIAHQDLLAIAGFKAKIHHNVIERAELYAGRTEKTC